MENLVARSDRRVDTALRLSIAGNIIDFGPSRSYDLVETINRVLAQPFAVDDSDTLIARMTRVDRVLILADNAGETVFDRVLIRELPLPAIYAVKAAPVLNDATVEDARAAGVDQVAQIVSTGSDSPGTILQSCSPEFRAIYDQAGLVLAKGQANYETLSRAGREVFFLLQTKCPVIARDVGVPVGSIVLKQSREAGTVN
jgi:uncharacterized protein with ATP-grasp and redox domains